MEWVDADRLEREVAAEYGAGREGEMKRPVLVSASTQIFQPGGSAAPSEGK